MRLKIIRIIIIVLFLMIVAELFYVQIIRGRFYYNLSVNNRIRVVPLEGWRGRIMGRRGEILADNKISYNVMVTPQEIKDMEGLFSFLSAVLGMDQARLTAIYRERKFTPFTPVTLAENIPRDKAIVIEENKFRFPSLFIQESFKRYYPLRYNSTHILGYVGKINRSRIEQVKEYGYSPPSLIGYSGVEEFYDPQLRGGDGGLQIEVNSRGQQVRLLSLREPTKGQDITLTIDTAIQQIAMELLADKTGTIVVMDTQNGEVLGLVSSPAYDPNYFIEKEYNSQLKRILSHPKSPLLNRAINGQFPPGSVFKIPVALAALDSKKITQHTTFSCPGYFEYGGVVFGDTCQYASQNLIESIAHSCNVYFYHLGLMLGAEGIYKYARALGLGELTNVDLPYEKPGFLPNRRNYLDRRKPWYAGNTINMSIGQGDVLTTPLQLVKMMSTVSREGIEVQPHLIKKIGEREVNQYNAQSQLKISKAVFEIIKQGMRATVTDPAGTAHDLNMPQVYVAGKTGTAQSSSNKEHHAWFVGYAQGDVRNIAFCVLLEHGGSSHNATFIARDLLLMMRQEQLL